MLTHSESSSNSIMQDSSNENSDCKKIICQNASSDELKPEETEDVQHKNSKEHLTYQCPDCPKIFEKKASFSAHYKVHKKKELFKNKSNFEPDLEEIRKFDLANILEEQTSDVLDKNSKAVVKEEIEITPQIFDTGSDWFNNDYENSE